MRGVAEIAMLPSLLYHTVSRDFAKKAGNCWIFMVAEMGVFARFCERAVGRRDLATAGGDGPLAHGRPTERREASLLR